MSRDKVGVLACVNDRGDVFLQEACLGKLGIDSARAALPPCALAGAIVSTDLQQGYARALEGMGVAVHRRFASSGPRAPLNRVNALHSSLKLFLAPFRGVSTRRLHHYLMWFKWAREARRGADGTALLRRQLEHGTYRTTRSGMARTPYPFHPELFVQGEG